MREAVGPELEMNGEERTSFRKLLTPPSSAVSITCDADLAFLVIDTPIYGMPRRDRHLRDRRLGERCWLECLGALFDHRYLCGSWLFL